MLLDLRRKAMANSTLLRKLLGAIRRIIGCYASYFSALVSVSELLPVVQIYASCYLEAFLSLISVCCLSIKAKSKTQDTTQALLPQDQINNSTYP
jgi:hypothetical protein